LQNLKESALSDMKYLLRRAVELSASDLHLSAGYPPMVRVNGVLRRLEEKALNKAIIHKMLDSILTNGQRKEYHDELEIDFAYQLEKISRFRCNFFCQMRGEAAAFRIIPSKILTLEDIKAPKGVYEIARKKKGLVLVTGPTGSGKSTTLAAIIDLINKERKDHILTIEDPIEYVHTGKNCLINQREVGGHSKSFAKALRSALREDPDVILVGEMRDLETINLAVTAAETGHFVLGTLHTSSAPETVDRVIDVFPADQQNQIRSVFSNSLIGVITQKLLPTKDGKGRLAVMEVMIASPAIRNLIRERKTHQMHTAIQTATGEGMQTFDQGLMERLNEGRIDIEQAKEYAYEKKAFEQWEGKTRTILEHVDL